MKKNFNIRNLIIVMLCITVICMGIGFVILASKLEQETKRQDTFSVEITKVEALTPVKGGYLDPTATKEITNDGKTVNFKFTLNYPKDELAYNVTIKNTGTLPVKIIKLLENPDYENDSKALASISPVTITHEKLENEVLKPNKEVTIKIIATYGMDSTSNQIVVPYQLSILATSTN